MCCTAMSMTPFGNNFSSTLNALLLFSFCIHHDLPKRLTPLCRRFHCRFYAQDGLKIFSYQSANYVFHFGRPKACGDFCARLQDDVETSFTLNTTHGFALTVRLSRFVNFLSKNVGCRPLRILLCTVLSFQKERAVVMLVSCNCTGGPLISVHLIMQDQRRPSCIMETCSDCSITSEMK